MLSRRTFLAGVGSVVGLTACGSRAAALANAAAANRRRLERIGIQLYTVRQEMQRDMPATLARIAEIGYREVEFAGYFRRMPREVRDLLARYNLAAPSTHVSLEAVRTERVFDESAEIGHRWVVVPSLPSEARRSRDTWKRVADEFNQAGERAKMKGLRFAFHNHGIEFARVDDTIPFDLLLESTDPALVSFQLDVFWTVQGGADPLAYIRKHPTRFTMLHIKDSAGPPQHVQTDVGAGVIDFRSILAQDASQRGAIQHVFVEHDDPADPFAFAKKSFDYLSTLEY